MADTAAVELMREGLTNYLDARYALGVFEPRIQESAKKVLNAHLAELKEALQAEKNDIWVERAEPCELERVVLGAAIGIGACGLALRGAISATNRSLRDA